MKKVVLAGMTLLLFMACGKQETRYTQQSTEIETVKQLIANYNNQDYDQSLYADTSKTYYNDSDNALSKDEVIPFHQENDKTYSSRGFKAENQEYEMVVTDDGHTWVNCWLSWEGTLKANGQKVEMPIHLTYRFVDGKIVTEYGYWDPTEIVMAQMEMEAAKNMSGDEKMMQATAMKVVKAWNTNDQDLMASVMTPDFVRMNSGVVSLNSAEAYGNELMASNYAAFPDFQVSMDKAQYMGNKALIHWTVTGTNKGEFNGNPPTNKPVEFHGLSIWTFNEDGKAVSEDAYYDSMSMMAQMGYTATPPE